MANVLSDSWDNYAKNVKLVLLFSIPFIISFLIPLFAPLPTFISGGAIFLRSASIFINISAVGIAVIILSVFLSLLFISFAIVAISLIVKAEKTHTKNTSSVIRGIEKYTSRVFLLLLLCTFALALVDVLSYYVGLQGIATPIVGFFLFAAVFYAPVAIVIDNKGLLSAVKRSVRHVVSEPKYFLLWVVLVVAVLTVLDFIAIHTLGTLLSRYALLLVNSLFVLPYFIIYQAEAYMRRFPVLKH